MPTNRKRSKKPSASVHDQIRAANNLALEQYRKNSDVVKAVEILTTKDSCDSCSLLSGKEYPLGDVPQLPNPNCTHTKGCRCTYAPVTYSFSELGLTTTDSPRLNEILSDWDIKQQNWDDLHKVVKCRHCGQANYATQTTCTRCAKTLSGD